MNLNSIRVSAQAKQIKGALKKKTRQYFRRERACVGVFLPLFLRNLFHLSSSSSNPLDRIVRRHANNQIFPPPRSSPFFSLSLGSDKTLAI